MAKNKKFIHTVMTSKIWLGVLAIFVLIVLYNSVSLFLKREKVWKKVGALEKEKKILLEQKEYIDRKNQSINDGIGRETILRDKFNVVKPGEGVIVLTEDKELSIPEEEPRGFWVQLRHFFKFDR